MLFNRHVKPLFEPLPWLFVGAKGFVCVAVGTQKVVEAPFAVVVAYHLRTDKGATQQT